MTSPKVIPGRWCFRTDRTSSNKAIHDISNRSHQGGDIILSNRTWQDNERQWHLQQVTPGPGLFRTDRTSSNRTWQDNEWHFWQETAQRFWQLLLGTTAQAVKLLTGDTINVLLHTMVLWHCYIHYVHGSILKNKQKKQTIFNLLSQLAFKMRKSWDKNIPRKTHF